MTRSAAPSPNAKRKTRKVATAVPEEAPRVKRTGNTASIVYAELRAKILDGTLSPGQPISQLSIAKASGTSRGPVREALRRLQQEQLVVAEANRRFSVASFDIADLEEVLGLHLVNIALTIRIATPFLSQDEVAHLRECADEMDKFANQDRFAWEAAFRRFALCFARHAGAHSVAIIGGLIDDAQRYRAYVLTDAPPVAHPSGKAFHEIILSAASGDGYRASILFADMFSRMASLIMAGAAPRYDAARLRSCIDAVLPPPDR
ncbi:GntR family transcriptional regulator [Paraburkholderia sp. J63]|uniref:GntR family transcriptional regulator n=1 Tax=Paraburkholderia sp. J63 TaxID=2805434 RepID=UPI002ABDB807|nr:GntR family transcriptional regulator [Paraburkholderia sp. J63]